MDPAQVFSPVSTVGGSRFGVPSPRFISGLPLEPDSDDKRRSAQVALEALVRFHEGLADGPASTLDGGEEYARRFVEPAPEQGARDFAGLVQVIREAAGFGFETAGPGFLGYVPGGGLWTVAIADMLASSLNKFVAMAQPAPALAQIEATVIDWFADLFRFPPGAGGILTSGGSMANFSAIVTARKAMLPDDFRRGTIYASDQTHASVAKAAMLAGFPASAVRTVPSDLRLRIDLQSLQDMIEADRQAGLMPFLLVGNAGTTNTGTVDTLEILSQMAIDERLWFHVDAAYGGFFQLTQRGSSILSGVETADSLTLDPHKGMFLPYGTGCLLVRQKRRLVDAHHVDADHTDAAYLQDIAAGSEAANFADMSPELSRSFRGLRIWLAVQAHGLAAFRQALDEKLDLARSLYEALSKSRGFELVTNPDLTIVAFRYRPPRGDADAFNRQLLDVINSSRRILLSSTAIHGQFVIRACVLNHRTHADRIEEAIEIIRGSAARLAG